MRRGKSHTKKQGSNQTVQVHSPQFPPPFSSQPPTQPAHPTLQNLPPSLQEEMAIQLDDLVQSIKSKVRFLRKSKKPYVKMDKSSSVKVEIRSRHARKLIDKTLRVADRPGKKSID
ncbi:hypothetical protein ACLOJK_036047 [Asimina triloba]